jgi:hypothetical protein
MKIIVKTTGSFSLYDPETLEPVNKERPHLVSNSQFFLLRMAAGQLKLLADNLPEHASDKDWADCLKQCDGDLELALEAFKAEMLAKTPKKETKAERKAREKAEKEAAERAAAEEEQRKLQAAADAAKAAEGNPGA